MGLDIYVGSLTRYYSQQWETVVQRWARENGYTVTVVGRESSHASVTDPSQIEPVVHAWRALVSRRLSGSLSQPLDWQDDMSRPYFTDKPDWDGWGALMLWAAHAEMPSVPLPVEFPENCFDAPLFHTWRSRPQETFVRAVLNCGWWLPGDDRFVFEMEDVASRNRIMGFGSQLLDELNVMSWKASPGEVEAWRKEGPAVKGDGLERRA